MTLAAHGAGLLVPDLPMEETAPIREAVSAAGLELTLLATPTTPEPRMRAIAELSQGFVYLVSVAGAPLRGIGIRLCVLYRAAVHDAEESLLRTDLSRLVRTTRIPPLELRFSRLPSVQRTHESNMCSDRACRVTRTSCAAGTRLAGFTA